MLTARTSLFLLSSCNPTSTSSNSRWSSFPRLTSLMSIVYVHFIVEERGEYYGGFLGSHCIDDDVYFAYGDTYGTRIKVVVITRNYQTTEMKEIKTVTNRIHQIYIEDKLNPFAKNERFSDNFVSKILTLCG